ncbi:MULTISPECIES: SixA phosphatase family protein [Streptomyces]|uniref:Phosphohistidine phosphatase n=1 Tax=Streptomyces viridochromogenes TaxID=1938 RepID=A0A0L8KKE9_STRVR|nr:MULTISPECIES: histidine phosphatase family protein [Streptomyces]KOG26356.1 phosphohistidine phosphatase [Streptomyces viridochromogenes]
MSLEYGSRRASPGGDGADGVRLLLVRHAKAVRKDRRIDDFDRELSKRGRGDAPRTGHWLAESGPRPDFVLCSPSRRTRQTWRLAAPALDDPPPVVYDDRLYNAPPSKLVSVLAERGPGLRAVALVGHNPGIHELAVGLCGSGPPDLLERVRAGFPTSGVVVIEVPGGWERLSPDSGRVIACWSPAD